MKVNVRITHVFEPRRGVNAQTNKPWCFQPIRVEWGEQGTRRDGTIYTIQNSLVVDICGQLAENFSIPVGAAVTLDLKMESTEYQGRFFNSIRSSYCTLCGTI